MIEQVKKYSLPEIRYFLGSRQSGKSMEILQAARAAAASGHRTVLVGPTAAALACLGEKAQILDSGACILGSPSRPPWTIRFPEAQGRPAYWIELLSEKADRFNLAGVKNRTIAAMFFDDVKPPIWVGHLPLKILGVSVHLPGIGYQACQVKLLSLPYNEAGTDPENNDLSFLCL